jgi:hypothetical protein
MQLFSQLETHCTEQSYQNNARTKGILYKIYVKQIENIVSQSRNLTNHHSITLQSYSWSY